MTDDTRVRRRPALSDEDKLQRRDEIMAAAKKVFARNNFLVAYTLTVLIGHLAHR